MRAAYQRHDSTATSAGSTLAIGSRTTRPPTLTRPALIARRARTISPTTGATTSSNRNAPTAARAAGITRRSPLAADEPFARRIPPPNRASSTAAANPNSIARRANAPLATPARAAPSSNNPPNPPPSLIVNRGSSLVGMTPFHHRGQT